jgi:hypothetical protein
VRRFFVYGGLKQLKKRAGYNITNATSLYLAVYALKGIGTARIMNGRYAYSMSQRPECGQKPRLQSSIAHFAD